MQNKLFAEFDTTNLKILVQLHSGRDHNKCLSPSCHDYMYSQEVAMSVLYSMITIVVPTGAGQILETTLPPKWGQLLLGFIITVLKKKKTWFRYTIVPWHSWHMFVNILLLLNEHELALKTFYKLLILIHASQRLVWQFDSCANFTKRMSIQIARIWTWNPPVGHFILEDLLILVPTLYRFTKLGHLIYAVT